MGCLNENPTAGVEVKEGGAAMRSSIAVSSRGCDSVEKPSNFCLSIASGPWVFLLRLLRLALLGRQRLQLYFTETRKAERPSQRKDITTPDCFCKGLMSLLQ